MDAIWRTKFHMLLMPRMASAAPCDASPSLPGSSVEPPLDKYQVILKLL